DRINTRGTFDRNRTMFDPMAKIALASNREPKVDDSSKAARDRLKLVKCLMSLAKEQIDHALEPRIIKHELPAILNWMLEGLQRCLKRAAAGGPLMVFTDKVEHDSMLFHDEQNPMARFVDQNVQPSETGGIVPNELFTRYQQAMVSQKLFAEQKPA